ncbi:MAG: DUF1826 domain-containing protein [Bdellovibrionota bacterium]
MAEYSTARRHLAMSQLRQARCTELTSGQKIEGSLLRGWMNDPEVNVITLHRPWVRLQESAEALLTSGGNWTLVGRGSAAETASTIRDKALELGACATALAPIVDDIQLSCELFFDTTGLSSAQGRLIFIQDARSPMHLSWMHVDTHEGVPSGGIRFAYRMLVAYVGGGVRWFANENVKPAYLSDLVRFGPDPQEALYEPDWWYDTPDNAIAFLRSNLPGGVAHVSPPFQGPRLRFDIW